MSFVPKLLSTLSPLRTPQSPGIDPKAGLSRSSSLVFSLSGVSHPSPSPPTLTSSGAPGATEQTTPSPRDGPWLCPGVWVSLGGAGLFRSCPGLLVTSYRLLWDRVCCWAGRREVTPPVFGCVCWGQGWRCWALALSLPGRVPRFSPLPTPPPVQGKSNCLPSWVKPVKWLYCR